MAQNITSRDLHLVLLSLILITAVYGDLRSQRIHNYLTFPGMVLGMLFSSAISGAEGFFFSVKGILIGMTILFVPYVLAGIGAGDVKLMGVVGGFLGIEGVFVAIPLSAIYGGLYALIIILIRRSREGFLSRVGCPSGESQPKKMCYSPAIALGSASYMVLDLMEYKLFL